MLGVLGNLFIMYVKIVGMILLFSVIVSLFMRLPVIYSVLAIAVLIIILIFRKMLIKQFGNRKLDLRKGGRTWITPTAGSWISSSPMAA